MFTGAQRGQRHPIQLPGTATVGVLLHCGHAAGWGCSVCVCVCVCVWQKTRRLAPGPATQPLHPEHTLSVFSGSRFPCWELSELGAQGHTPKGSWKKRSQLCSGHTLNEGSRLVLPVGLRVHCPVQSWACPPAPPSLPPSCTLTQQEPGASSV